MNSTFQSAEDQFEDVEGHGKYTSLLPDIEDVEGHGFRGPLLPEEGEDVEGHGKFTPALPDVELMNRSRSPYSVAATTRHSGHKRLRRTLFTLPLAAVLALAALITGAPAQAAIYAGAGSFGYHAVPSIDCRHKVFGTSGVLEMTANPPTVFTHNFRAGAGNDGSYVRYRVFLVDYNTKQTLDASNFSAFAWAKDNVAARWNGYTQFSPNWRGHYLIDYRIEWWNPGASAPYAWSAYRADQYKYVSANTVAGGVWSSCMKVY